jgi:hypothetical protein
VPGPADVHMQDQYFREILGIDRDASRDTIRKAYRQRVMENHPDRFPPDRKPTQELMTITLTEAYSALMHAAAGEEARPGPGSGERGPRVAPAGAPSENAPAASPAATATAAAATTAAPGSALTRPRDPSYAYYKQGFISFSLAIHGIADVNRRIAAGRIPTFSRRYTATEYFGTSLSLLREAHGYFTRVVERHPDCVWAADSRWKLHRIEQFTTLYRRILRNLRGD